ncbi:MAG: carboxymuconolactone decarboxylase family protein [Colwellia sp.]|nr:carboxymuconolactone decarboxylase family protein [Colwellia sp.]
MLRIPFENIPKPLMNCMIKTENYLKSLNIIDESFMEILRYHASMLNKCAYCIDMHFKEALNTGETALRIYSSITWRDVDFYSETEKALLAWTESVTLLNDESNKYRQQAFDNLSQYFSQDEIANLTLAIMQINSWIRLAKSFGFEAGTYQIGQH